MKKVTLSFIVLSWLLVSCSNTVSSSSTERTQPTMAVPTLTSVPTLTPTVTDIPSPTPTPTPQTERDLVLAQHEQERIQYLAEQGAADSIPALEYHGDNYYIPFPNGAVVEISPEAFKNQMKWFSENHIHAVTGDELISWLRGEIELPARSVLLTFDMGNGSLASIERMLKVFQEYKMFGIFTIFTYGMDPSQSVTCKGDICWPAYRDAYASGYATIGSHTLTHRDFATLSASEGLNELAQSKALIESKIGQGLIVNVLTWPFESIPSWGSQISSVGFEAGFGGNTYPILSNTAWLNKPDDYFQLPRIMPPGSGGISGRPNGKTLEEILTMYTNGWNK